MTGTTQTISQRIKILPPVIKDYLKGDGWDNDFQSVLDNHSVNPQKSEKVKLELFLYLIIMQNKEEVRKQIQDVLSTYPSPITNQIFNELMKSIPGPVKEIINNTLNSVGQQKPNIKPVPIPPKESTSESEAGVDIERDREEEEIKETPERDSVIRGIENPNETETFKKPNPISSKLSGKTSGASSYTGQDPYREPIE